MKYRIEYCDLNTIGTTLNWGWWATHPTRAEAERRTIRLRTLYPGHVFRVVRGG